MLASLTDGGNGGDDLAKLELVEDSGLTGGVETNLFDGGGKRRGFSQRFSDPGVKN